MAQTNYTPISLYYSTTASAAPTSGNLVNGELAINITDGKLYYKSNAGTVTLLASAAGASGDVVGPSSATDNALVRFDTTTGKLVQNSVGILSDAGVLTGLTGLTSSGNVTLSALTATRVPYASTGGLIVDSANMTFDGTKLTVAGLKDSALTSGRVTYATTSGELTDSANLTFDGTTLTANALTVSNAVTLSGGTANGVAYLNGSKVLTTGSALTFDGTNFGVRGGSFVSTTSADANYKSILTTVYSDSATTQLYNKTNLVLSAGTADGTIFYNQSGSEQMRLTSTGLGIGTSTIPTVGSTTVLAVGNSSGGTLGIVQSGSIAYRISASTSGVDCYNPNSSPITWYTAGTGRLTLNATGDLQLSTGNLVIASGGAATYKITLTNTGSQLAGINYSTSSPVSYMDYYSLGTAGTWQGAHRFYVSNNSATPVLAATIDSSANFGLGTTSPSSYGKFAVVSGLAQQDAVFLNGYAQMRNIVGGPGVGGSWTQWYADNTPSFVGAIGTAVPGNSATGALLFSTYSGSWAERARIDSSGNLLVGTTSNTTGSPKMYVVGARAAIFQSSQANTGGTQTYCTSANSDEPSVLAGNNSSASSGVGTFYSSLGNGNGSQSNTNCYHLKAVTQGVGINYLYGNGTTSFTSDARLKKNITSTRDGYAEDLCKLRVVKYNWNTAPEGEAQELGLIAQEVEQVFPGLVQDADTEIQGFTPKVLKGSVLPFMLLKAIQEQQALITQLKARLDAANI